MNLSFDPFTPELFRKQTGLNAEEHEGVYLRWVNAQINYENYRSMKHMNESLQQIISLLKENGLPPKK